MPQAMDREALRRASSLAIVGLAFMLLVYGTIRVAYDVADARDQLEQLRDNDRAALADEVRSRLAAAPAQVAPSMSGQDLISPDGVVALSLMQQTFQKLVDAPAKLESLHSLDPMMSDGLTVVRASFRIRDLQPQQVLETIQRMETNRPPIVFDELRISIQTRLPPIQAVAGFAAPATNLAELTGIAQTYALAPKIPQPSDAGRNEP